MRTVFDNRNAGAVQNNPTQPTTFSVAQPMLISALEGYFWNDGLGLNFRDPVTGRLYRIQPPAVRYSLTGSQSGTQFGPYISVGSPGQNNVQDVNWRSNPNIVIPAGRYTVDVVDPAHRVLWSQNSGEGFMFIEGEPATIGPIAKIFDNSNVDQVFSSYFGPPIRTTFEVSKPTLITTVQTYHYNNGLGAGAFPVAITIRDAISAIGPIPSVGVPRAGGAPMDWVSTFYTVLRPGQYVIECSSWSTWSFNQASGNKGFAIISGD
jgi:hypothetical protein